MSEVKKLLKQLNRKELLNLAKIKRAKIKDDTPKPKLMEILSPFVTEKDIRTMLSKKGRTGALAVLDGALFEKKALTYFSRRGYKCEIGDVRIKGMEFDIAGIKESGRVFKEKHWIVAECKNKPKVIMQDWDKFLGKFTHFRKKHEGEKVIGFLITSGVFDPMVKSASRVHPYIKLLRIKG